MNRQTIVRILTILMILSINLKAVQAVSISSYTPGPRKLIEETINSNWIVAKSNSDFAFTEIIDETSGIKTLKLKNKKTGFIKTLIQSTAIERLGQIRDVSPNGRTVIFETLVEVDGEYINQTFLFNTNGQKFFLLSDGVRRKKEETVDLVGINFHDKKVELSYKRNDREELEKKTIELVAKYSLIHNINKDEDRIAKFYGGSIPYGVKDLKSFAKEGKVHFELSFDQKISSIKKHEFIIENNKIIKFLEFNKDDKIFDSKTEFLRNGHITENFIYNKNNELIYSGASFGNPSIDLISLNQYLRKEIKEFYQGSLGDKAKISILGKKIFIDLNDGSKMPIHSLLFAFSYSNFGDYGFYSLSRQSRDMKSKEIFTFSNKNNSIRFSKSFNSRTEAIVINDINHFNYDYAEISSGIYSSRFIGLKTK